MKLCIPVRVLNGLESCLEPHLPHAEYLLFFDTDTRQFEQISLRERQDGAGKEIPFDVVLCGSIDSATKQALAAKGVQAFGTDALTAGEAIAEFEAMNPPGGHGHASHAGGCGCGGHGDEEHGHRHAGGGCQGGTVNAPANCDGKGGCGCGGHGHDDHEHEHTGGGCQSGAESASTGCGGKGGCGCGGHGHERHPGEEAFARKMRADALRVAVTSQNQKTVTDHAGRCRKFWVYEIRQNKVDNKALRELTLEQTFHSAELGPNHPLDDVHVLITTGMSPFLYQRLQKGGIRGFITDESDPDRAVEMLLQKVAAA